MSLRNVATPLPGAGHTNRAFIDSTARRVLLLLMPLILLVGCQNQTPPVTSDASNLQPKVSERDLNTAQATDVGKRDSSGSAASEKSQGDRLKTENQERSGTKISDRGEDVGRVSPPEIAAPVDSSKVAGDEKSTRPVKGDDEQQQGASQTEQAAAEKDLPFEYQKLLEQSRNPVKSELPPLPEGFKQLGPEQEIWINSKEQQVLLGGRICFRDGVLEMFACMRHSKEHESIIAVNAKSSMLHAALLAVGAEPGQPVVWDPEYRPASGPKISIDVSWLDSDKKLQTVRAQEMIINAKTNKTLELDWVFGGSGFWKDPEDNKEYYRGDGGDMICVSNFASATLDLPVESSNSNDFLMYRANPEKVPPLETRVYLLLKPQLPK